MSTNLQEFLPILEAISSIKLKADRDLVVRIFCKNDNFVKAIKEIATNTVEGNIPLEIEDKLKLRKQKAVLIALAGKRGKQALRQRGAGFLPILLPIISTILGSIVNGEG